MGGLKYRLRESKIKRKLVLANCGFSGILPSEIGARLSGRAIELSNPSGLSSSPVSFYLRVFFVLPVTSCYLVAK